MIAAFGHGARRLLLREVGVAMSAARTDAASLPRFELGNMRMAIAGERSLVTVHRAACDRAPEVWAQCPRLCKAFDLAALSLATAVGGLRSTFGQHN